jgi:drug/metabolite transporter (DMT)-like permease
VALLASTGGFGASGAVGLLGALAVMVGSISWAYGSIRARTIALPTRMPLNTAMQMLWGGAFLLCSASRPGSSRAWTRPRSRCARSPPPRTRRYSDP